MTKYNIFILRRWKIRVVTFYNIRDLLYSPSVVSHKQTILYIVSNQFHSTELYQVPLVVKPNLIE